MNKKSIIIILAIIILGGAGFYIALKQGVDETEKDMNKFKGTNLLEWLQSGKGVKCTVYSEDGTVTIQAKGGNVRVDGFSYAAPGSTDGEEGKGTSLTVGDMFYMWSGQQGTKINKKKMEEIAEKGEEQEEIADYSWEDMADDWQDQKVTHDCRETSISDDIFTPPSDVEFKDITKMMEDMKEISNKLEESFESGEVLDMEDLQKQLEGLQNLNQEDIEKKLEDLDIEVPQPE